ncbi:MAG: hypothetical protein REV35_01195 [Burkholderia sp.]|nr:hypothetical protein [Burkholderia sp.]
MEYQLSNEATYICIVSKAVVFTIIVFYSISAYAKYNIEICTPKVIQKLLEHHLDIVRFAKRDTVSLISWLA